VKKPINANLRHLGCQKGGGERGSASTRLHPFLERAKEDGGQLFKQAGLRTYPFGEPSRGKERHLSSYAERGKRGFSRENAVNTSTTQTHFFVAPTEGEDGLVRENLETMPRRSRAKETRFLLLQITSAEKNLGGGMA